MTTELNIDHRTSKSSSPPFCKTNRLSKKTTIYILYIYILYTGIIQQLYHIYIMSIVTMIITILLVLVSLSLLLYNKSIKMVVTYYIQYLKKYSNSIPIQYLQIYNNIIQQNYYWYYTDIMILIMITVMYVSLSVVFPYHQLIILHTDETCQ